MIEQLTINNLHLGCQARNKDEVLNMVGTEFKNKGYVDRDCVPFLIEREQQISTFLGNGITLPHLPKSANDIIMHAGVEIFQFPDGVIWDRTNVMFIAIGVTAKSSEHIDIIREISLVFSDEFIASALSITSNKDEFLSILHR
ncbi:TPA: PTS sugar transporter subunit IIA [Escherichia coli]|nr:PTS sugar transporter subunit IIA [Escherichia coli]